MSAVFRVIDFNTEVLIMYYFYMKLVYRCWPTFLCDFYPVVSLNLFYFDDPSES
jgi:hypothetical protein